MNFFDNIIITNRCKKIKRDTWLNVTKLYIFLSLMRLKSKNRAVSEPMQPKRLQIGYICAFADIKTCFYTQSL